MQIVESCIFPPGCCFLTGSSEGPFIDTGKDHANARIYVSLRAVNDLATAFGMLSAQGVELLKEQVDELHEELARLEGIEATYDDLRAAVTRTLVSAATQQKGGKWELKRYPRGTVNRREGAANPSGFVMVDD